MLIVQQLAILIQLVIATYLVGSVQRAETPLTLRWLIVTLGIITFLSITGYQLMITTTDHVIATAGAVLLAITRAGGFLGSVTLIVIAIFYRERIWARRLGIILAGSLLALYSAILLDLIFGQQWFLTGAPADYSGGYVNSLQFMQGPGQPLLQIADTGTFICAFGLLLGAVVQRKGAQRRQAIIVFGSLALAPVTLAGQEVGLVGAPQLLVLLALCEAIIRRQMLAPQITGITLALQSMREAVILYDRDGYIVYTNTQAMQLGFQNSHSVMQTLEEVGASSITLSDIQSPTSHTLNNLPLLTIGDQHIVFTSTSIVDDRNRHTQTLLLGRDVTETEHQKTLLEQEHEQLLATIHELETSNQERAALFNTIQELSAPVIPILPGVLVAPVIGTINNERATIFRDNILRAVEQTRAKHVLIDITGVPIVDTQVAQLLMQTAEALRLIGAQVQLVGVRPEVAQTIIALDLDLSILTPAVDLQAAVQTLLKDLPYHNNKFRGH